MILAELSSPLDLLRTLHACSHRLKGTVPLFNTLDQDLALSILIIRKSLLRRHGIAAQQAITTRLPIPNHLTGLPVLSVVDLKVHLSRRVLIILSHRNHRRRITTQEKQQHQSTQAVLRHHEADLPPLYSTSEKVNTALQDLY